MENTKGTFKKYVRSRFPSFDPPLPLSSLVRFQNPDLLEGPKDGMIKENAVFFILKSSNKVDYISTLITPDHEVKIIYNQWISSIVWVGKSYRTPIIDRTEYYNLSCWFV